MKFLRSLLALLFGGKGTSPNTYSQHILHYSNKNNHTLPNLKIFEFWEINFFKQTKPRFRERELSPGPDVSLW